MIRADVVVVGGSLAGLVAARELALGGADVQLLEAADVVGDGASGRNPGLFFRGLIEHPHRLVHALGAGRTRELYDFSASSLDALEALAPELVDRSGGWWCALDDREPAQLTESAAALASIGVASALRDDAADVLGLPVGLGLFVEGDGSYDPRSLLAALHAAAVDAGVSVQTSRRVGPIGQADDGDLVVDGVRCSAVVLAAGHELRHVDHWFADKLTPVREQTLRVRHPRVGAARAGYGYTFWRSDGDDVVVGGCRWATQHMEVAETEPVVVPVIQDKIADFVRRMLPDAGPPRDPVAWIDTHTCDALPIIGPLPGQPQLVACTGMVANCAGLGAAAGKAVADGLLHGRDELPDFLHAGRFL